MSPRLVGGLGCLPCSRKEVGDGHGDIKRERHMADSLKATRDHDGVSDGHSCGCFNVGCFGW